MRTSTNLSLMRFMKDRIESNERHYDEDEDQLEEQKQEEETV
jgi:hypothetical protein